MKVYREQENPPYHPSNRCMVHDAPASFRSFSTANLAVVVISSAVLSFIFLNQLKYND